jgi:hypothetical protein
MTYTTLLAVDVPVDLMSRLDELARAQKVTRSTLVRGALASFAGVELHSRGNPYSNRDGKDTAAEQIIGQHPDLSIRELVGKLSDAGINRKKTWVSEARIRMRGTRSALRG